LGLDFSPEQIKEKFRNLKRVFAEAKVGKHRGELWDSFTAMRYLFDDDIVEAIPPQNVTYG
jgi:hypothetical protein